MMQMFRELDETETKEFQQWARDNYEVGSKIKTIWHPVVQAECKKMNEENIMTIIKNPIAENSITQAIIVMMKMTNDELIIMACDTVAILPAILSPNDGNYDEQEIELGADIVIEYQVSDAIENRSRSFDFYSFKEAVECYNKIKENGWDSV